MQIIEDSNKLVFGKYHNLVLLLLGFFLSTIIGGGFGSYFQNKSWYFKNRVKLQEEEQKVATNIFEQISTVMDKRLYRSRLWFWRMESNESPEEIYKYLNQYRLVLYEWNDNLNRNLALIQRYFGKDLKIHFLNEINDKFGSIGSDLEKMYKGSFKDDILEIDKKMDSLNITIYKFNVALITLIQNRKIGTFRDDKFNKSLEL